MLKFTAYKGRPGATGAATPSSSYIAFCISDELANWILLTENSEKTPNDITTKKRGVAT